jgi:hypothetical protein
VTSNASKSSTGAIGPGLSLLLWLTVQLGALVLASGRVQLSAGFPSAGQRLAPDELLIVQFVFSGMLFPILLGDCAQVLILILTAAPLLQLAGILSGHSAVQMALSWCCLSLWIGTLWIFQSILCLRLGTLSRASVDPAKTAWTSPIGGWVVALANFISVGGLLLWYLESEFGARVSFARVFPLPALLKALHAQAGFGLPLLSTAVILVISIVFFVVQRLAHLRRG